MREIGLASALPAHDRRELLDQRVRWNAIDEIFGHCSQQSDFAVGRAAEDYDAAFDFGAQLVSQIAEVAALDVVGPARDELHAVDVHRRFGGL